MYSFLLLQIFKSVYKLMGEKLSSWYKLPLNSNKFLINDQNIKRIKFFQVSLAVICIIILSMCWHFWESVFKKVNFSWIRKILQLLCIQARKERQNIYLHIILKLKSETHFFVIYTFWVSFIKKNNRETQESSFHIFVILC